MALGCALLLAGCANRGIGPQGGPKDTTPPVIVKTTPEPYATNVPAIGTVITLETNENINIKDATKIVVSPPQKNRPGIKGVGKHVTVSFSDTLKANSTYSIQFGKNIVDYTEGNPMDDYEFVFSTGGQIDSLRVSGTVLDARTLQPMEGMEIGLQSDLTDSAFYKQPFDYIAVTDAKGKFTITGVRDGDYRLYALKDVANTYAYTHIGSEIAFYDSIIRPEVHLHATIDTLWSDSTHTAWDSLDVQTFTQYLPNDVLLLSLTEDVSQQFFRKATRPLRGQLNLLFNKDLTEAPKLELLDNPQRQDWIVRGFSERKDSCIYWIKDTTLLSQDTLRLTLTYHATAGLGLDTLRCDTLTVNYRQLAAKRKASASDSEWTLLHNLNKSLEINDSVRIGFREPVMGVNDTLIHLQVKQDTLWNPVPFVWQVDNAECITQVIIDFDRDWEASYRLQVDSLAFTSWYGHQSMPLTKPFQLKKPEEYANLYVKVVADFDDGHVELMNDKEVVLRTEPMGDEAAFEDLTPGTYLVRLYRDLNGNGKWDTGSVLEHRQGEPVYYYPKKLQLRPNWDDEETWEPLTIEWEKQRP